MRCSALVAALCAARVGRGGSPNRLGDWGQSPLPEISKEHDFQSAFANRKSFLIRWHLHTGFRKQGPLRTADATTSEFCFEIFPLLCLPLRKSAERLNRKVKDQAERVISTPELNTLLCLYPEPINVVVYHDPSGRSHLGIGLALRCFQRLSFPNIATQRCR